VTLSQPSTQIEENRRRDDGNDAAMANRKTDPSLLKKLHDPSHSVETKGTVAAQSHSMDSFNQIHGVEEICLPCSGCSPPNINPTDSTALRKNYGDPGHAFQVGGMADGNPPDIGNTIEIRLLGHRFTLRRCSKPLNRITVSISTRKPVWSSPFSGNLLFLSKHSENSGGPVLLELFIRDFARSRKTT
jgi:hypothetical protein